MKRVMHRLFWAWDFDREEDWLNAWAARGLALVDAVSYTHLFCMIGCAKRRNTGRIKSNMLRILLTERLLMAWAFVSRTRSPILVF